MTERYALTFKANGKPDALYKTNQTVFDYSKLSGAGVDYAEAHKKIMFLMTGCKR